VAGCRKAVVMNVSDFAAKGVRPIAVLVSLGVPRDFGRKKIDEIGLGLNAGARQYGAYVVGETRVKPQISSSAFLFLGLARRVNWSSETGQDLATSWPSQVRLARHQPA